jgi:large subunit ribosomal protein L7Ae
MDERTKSGEGKSKTIRPYFVKFETPKEISDAAYDALRQAKKSGKIARGANGTTRAVERGVAKLVIIAEDVEPPEVVAHLPIICEERNVPFVFVPTRASMGPALGIDVGATSACIIESGDAQSLIDQIVSAVQGLKHAGEISLIVHNPHSPRHIHFKKARPMPKYGGPPMPSYNDMLDSISKETGIDLARLKADIPRLYRSLAKDYEREGGKEPGDTEKAATILGLVRAGKEIGNKILKARTNT